MSANGQPSSPSMSTTSTTSTSTLSHNWKKSYLDKFKMLLLIFGYGRWKKILKEGGKKKVVICCNVLFF